jgi:hypothetical protein
MDYVKAHALHLAAVALALFLFLMLLVKLSDMRRARRLASH